MRSNVSVMSQEPTRRGANRKGPTPKGGVRKDTAPKDTAPKDTSPKDAAPGDGRWDVRQSRSVQSVWIWRGFLMMALIAAGIAIALGSNGATGYAIGWGVIAAGWFGISMYLWRIHSVMEEQEYNRLLNLKKRR